MLEMVLTLGMGDALNARSFLLEYCKQKNLPRNKVTIYTGRHKVFFENDGFIVKDISVKPKAKLYHYPNLGDINIPKVYNNELKRDETIAKNAGINFTFSMINPLNWEETGIGRIKLPEKFITINYGFDNVSDPNKVCAKAWLIGYWNELVSKLNIPCVQIGAGRNCIIIKGTELNLVDKLTIKQSAEVLKKALFHIDIEGGLAILNHHLGGRTAVLFGPTSLETHALEGNLNIVNNTCKDCPCEPDVKGVHHGIYMRKNKIACTMQCMKELKPNFVISKLKEAEWI